MIQSQSDWEVWWRKPKPGRGNAKKWLWSYGAGPGRTEPWTLRTSAPGRLQSKCSKAPGSGGGSLPGSFTSIVYLCSQHYVFRGQEGFIKKSILSSYKKNDLKYGFCWMHIAFLPWRSQKILNWTVVSWGLLLVICCIPWFQPWFHLF